MEIWRARNSMITSVSMDDALRPLAVTQHPSPPTTLSRPPVSLDSFPISTLSFLSSKHRKSPMIRATCQQRVYCLYSSTVSREETTRLMVNNSPLLVVNLLLNKYGRLPGSLQNPRTECPAKDKYSVHRVPQIRNSRRLVRMRRQVSRMVTRQVHRSGSRQWYTIANY